VALLNEGDIVIEGNFEELENSDVEFVREFLKYSSEDTCRKRRG
jgi:ABC-type transporter Mla maintaining outer membrane lipid asymmetry ATPase subunit MlaF